MGDEIRSTTIRIRELEYHPQSRLLVVKGQETQLDRRSAMVFQVLLERVGQRIGKDELLATAWPNQVVHENSLAKAISKLRRNIRGSGVEIAASYGYGYALRETAVSPSPLAAAPAANDGSPTTGARIQGNSARRRLAALVGALLLVVVSSYALTRSGTSHALRDTPLILHDAPDAVATILWVDDHPSNNRLEVDFLRGHRIAVHQAETTEDALKLLAMNSYGLVVSDLGRGEDRLAGLKMLEDMKKRQMEVPVLIYTMRPKTPSGQEAQRRMVAEADASGLAVTPQEVRAEILRRLQPST